MTPAELYTSITLVTLLIVGLMLYLRLEFKKIGLQSWISDYQKEKKKAGSRVTFGNGQSLEPTSEDVIRQFVESNAKAGYVENPGNDLPRPKRRKYRDNPQRGGDDGQRDKMERN